MGKALLKVGDVSVEIIDGVLREWRPKSDGLYQSWHANGVQKMEGAKVNGCFEGIVREWHENGNLAMETPYEKGRINGIARQWSVAGKLLGEYEMKMGRGVRRTWNDDGSLSLEFEELSEHAIRGVSYDDLGKPHETFLWDGKPISRKKCYERIERALNAIE